MKPGKYKAYVLDKIISENKSGNPQVVISLDVEFSDGERHVMNYYGQLSEKAAEYTMNALVACGIQGNSVADPITKGLEVSVTVAEEIGQDGKSRLKIAWINKPSSMGIPMDESKARMALKKFEGQLAALRQNQPTTRPLKNYAPKLQEPDFSDSEDVPF
jgi:hypothetical protein